MTDVRLLLEPAVHRRRAVLFTSLLLLAGLLPLTPATLSGQTLRGSSASLDRQVRQAEEHDFTFLQTPAQVERFVKAGYLVPVRANRDLDLHAVSFPYARPETRTFILRLAEQYRRACGEKLVVTSLTRPTSRQPANASSRSVHPTGMAADLRRTNDPACRSWLERTLLSLEKEGVLEAIRENNPPHYHVAVYPKPYTRYVEALATRQAETRFAAADIEEYQVRRGDSLWTIARAHGTTVDRLREENSLRGSRIYAGQLLKVPVESR
jgi:LysM repeat protein